MEDPAGFLRYRREEAGKQFAGVRVRHWHEYEQTMPERQASLQARRCMDCGTPYCHSYCPVHNLIPDWNALVNDGDWQRAYEQLESTNNFPAGVHVGSNLDMDELRRNAHAVVLACGSEQPRDLHVPGRSLGGIHVAMDYLRQQNRREASASLLTPLTYIPVGDAAPTKRYFDSEFSGEIQINEPL
jgi:NADPH-dependent glutamate synthase beta subunit-like oxidoreductase